ncbi:MAG: hypothetical protein LBC42_03685 [Puniceicoccales bacterium]|jgi:hypothetical protein|nr:hypothetical protein [Puniceicoccales bacterium]
MTFFRLETERRRDRPDDVARQAAQDAINQTNVDWLIGTRNGPARAGATLTRATRWKVAELGYPNGDIVVLVFLKDERRVNREAQQNIVNARREETDIILGNIEHLNSLV